jgi:hypothetical protein
VEDYPNKAHTQGKEEGRPKSSPLSRLGMILQVKEKSNIRGATTRIHL